MAAAELVVAVTVASDECGDMVFIAKEGVGISEAAALGEQVMANLKAGGYEEGSGDIDAVTSAFVEAGFQAPAYLKLEARW